MPELGKLPRRYIKMEEKELEREMQKKMLKLDSI